MTPADHSRSTHALDVPLSTVPARGSRRGLVAALAIGAALVGAVGLSVLAGQPPGGLPEPSAIAQVPSVSSVASPSASPSDSPVPMHLPEVESVSLEGAPGLAFVRHDGDALVVLGWHPDGRGLTEIGRIADAYAGIDADPEVLGSVSHDARFALVRTSISDAIGNPDFVRIVGRGGVVWEKKRIESTAEALWANDANRVVVPVDEDTWVVVDLEGGQPRVHTIRIVGVEPPGPPPGLDFVARPIAFSADGRWIYGEAPANVDARNRTLFKAPATGGRASRIRALPTAGSSRAISDRYDPATGRTVDPTGFPNGNISSLIVRNPDGSKAWEVRFPAIVNTAWLGDGRLAVMHSDRFDGPRYVSLVTLDGNGDIIDTLLEAGPVSGGGLLGARNGFAVAGYFVQTTQELLLVMFDPDQERASTLHLTGREVLGLQLGGWLEPSD
jgi:hypothetical protein